MRSAHALYRAAQVFAADAHVASDGAILLVHRVSDELLLGCFFFVGALVVMGGSGCLAASHCGVI